MVEEEELEIVAIRRQKVEKCKEDKDGKKLMLMEEFDVAILNDENGEKKATIRFPPRKVKVGDSFTFAPFMKQTELDK